jgi:hypothetical protein
MFDFGLTQNKAPFLVYEDVDLEILTGLHICCTPIPSEYKTYGFWNVVSLYGRPDSS